MIAFIYPITTIKPFLASKGHNVEEVEKMHQAWFKSVTSGYALFIPMQKITIFSPSYPSRISDNSPTIFDMSASALPSPSHQPAQSAHGK